MRDDLTENTYGKSKQPEASLHGLLKQPQARFEAKDENSKSQAQNPK